LQMELTDGAKGTGNNAGGGDKTSIYVLNKKGGVWYANKLDDSFKAVQVLVPSKGRHCPTCRTRIPNSVASL
jgi:hypothetical protein